MSFLYLGALYMRSGTGKILSRLCMKNFKPGRDIKIGWAGFCPSFLSMELIKLFHSLLMLVEVVDKTVLLNPIFRSTSSFSVLLINFICEIKNNNVLEHLSLNIRKHLWEKHQHLPCNRFLLNCWKCPE